MILLQQDRIGCGAYSDVFRPAGTGALVYKLFISGRHERNLSQLCDDTPEARLQRQNTFAAECEAYVLAGRDPWLRLHIPGSFMRCHIADVRDAACVSVSDRYMLDRCYAIGYISGKDRKLGALRAVGCVPPHIKEALLEFRARGICYLEDVSIFFHDDPERFIFIDFATNDFPPGNHVD